MQKERIQFDFEVTYKSSDDVKFRMLPMRPQDVDESAELLTKIFISREPISLALESTHEDILPFLNVMTQKSMEQGLGVVVKDDNEKIVGAMVTVDDYLEKQDPIDFTKCGKKALDIQDMLHKYARQNNPEKPFDSVNTILVGVAEEIGSKGAKLGTKLLDFLMKSHPSHPKKVWGHTTNPVSSKISANVGCKLKGVFDPKEYTNSEGEFIFKDIDNVSKKLFKKPYPGVLIYEFDHSDFIMDSCLVKPKL